MSGSSSEQDLFPLQRSTPCETCSNQCTALDYRLNQVFAFSVPFYSTCQLDPLRKRMDGKLARDPSSLAHHSNLWQYSKHSHPKCDPDTSRLHRFDPQFCFGPGHKRSRKVSRRVLWLQMTVDTLMNSSAGPWIVQHGHVHGLPSRSHLSWRPAYFCHSCWLTLAATTCRTSYGQSHNHILR